MYRFHPSVQWQSGYPDKQQIVGQVRQLWQRYGLDAKTKFNFRVDKAYQDDRARWIINSPANGRYEGLIAAVGTCGDVKMPSLPGMDRFKGEMCHSSELTGYVWFPLFHPVLQVKMYIFNYYAVKTPRARKWPS